jgi:phosphonate transport system substrate-binding protein
MLPIDRGRIYILLCLILMMAVVAGCSNDDTPRKINLEAVESFQKVEKQTADRPVRIAVGGMITPREGFVYYHKFLQYIGKKLNRHVEFVDRESYAEINDLLKTGDVDVAFVCGGPYVDGREDFGMELLAAPVAYGEAVYYSYIIVAKGSPVRSFLELRGKKFAFTDPMSNSGKLVPTYMLAMMNETPDTFFGSYIFSRTHDNAIRAVAQGIVDGAAVDSLVWEYLNRTDPELTSRTRIIEKSPPYGIPPVVVRPGLDPGLKQDLKNIFLNIHNDKKGKQILGKMMIDKFIPAKDGAYDSIREMKAWIAEKKRKKEQADKL